MLCRRMSSPCRRHGWGQSPRRLQSSIRRRQFNHEAKMCARTDIFARPSIPQTHLWCVEASAVKNCIAILPADIIPRSKNVCSHRHFCEAVNCADAPLVRGGVSREELHSNSSCGYYTTKQKCVLAQTFLRGRQCHIVQHTMLHGRRHAADSLHLQGVM